MSEITEIIQMCEFESDDAKYCEECFAKIKADSELYDLLRTAEKHYMMGYNPAKEQKLLYAKSGIHRYTVDLILLIYCMNRLRKLYAAHGYTDELLKETMALSLRLNVDSCKKIYGIVGNFVFFAYKRHFACERFALGRLQFEAIPLPFDYKDKCKKGDMVLSCHIPSTGPLLMEDVEAAFKQAKEFYNISGPLVVVCSSWLLYPAHYEKLYPKNSNLSKFYELFDVVQTRECTFAENAWRVFDTMDPDLTKVPQNTTLQKNLYNYLKDGNVMGTGYGILIREY